MRKIKFNESRTHLLRRISESHIVRRIQAFYLFIIPSEVFRGISLAELDLHGVTTCNSGYILMSNVHFICTSVGVQSL